MTVTTASRYKSKNPHRFRRGENGHDAYVRETLNQEGAPQALLRKYMPRQIQKGLRMETVRPADPTLIDRRLRRRFADLLFQVDTVDGKAEFLYVLVEHKSYRDPHVAVQLLEYIALIYRRWVHQYGKTGQPVPELSVLVIYHGTEPWNVPTRFSGLYENPNRASRLSVDFGYVLLDLSETTIQSMPEHAELRAGLAALKHSKRRVLTKEDAELLAKALMMANQDFRQVTVDYLDRAFQHAPRKVFFDTASKTISEDVKMFASAAEKYTTLGHRKGRREGREEGRAEGIEEGMQKGMQKGRIEGELTGQANTLTLLLAERFGAVSPAVRNRIRAADKQKLDTWALRILRA